MWQLYLFLVGPVVLIFIFKYIPIYGLYMAFVDFRIGKNILSSPWNNFENFRLLFASTDFSRYFFNTIIISVMRIAFVFPAPILFALLLNEVRREKFKRVVQSIAYLPHFMSWVVLAGLVGEFLSPQRGIVNYIITLFGGEPIYFLSSTKWFRPILIITDIWRSIGWGSIIYLAALSSVDVSSYEAAELDGANRFQVAWHISIPSILPIISIMLILRMGHIMNAGFDQVFNLYSPVVYSVADIIDTYVYRAGILNAQYGYTTAVGLFKNVIGFVLVIGTNMLVRRTGDYGIW
jgi:putative aldouronate transport system permease protein